MFDPLKFLANESPNGKKIIEYFLNNKNIIFINQRWRQCIKDSLCAQTAHTHTHRLTATKKIKVPQKHYIHFDFSYLSHSFLTNFFGSINITRMVVAIVVHNVMDFVVHPPEEMVYPNKKKIANQKATVLFLVCP